MKSIEESNSQMFVSYNQNNILLDLLNMLILYFINPNIKKHPDEHLSSYYFFWLYINWKRKRGKCQRNNNSTKEQKQSRSSPQNENPAHGVGIQLAPNRASLSKYICYRFCSFLFYHFVKLVTNGGPFRNAVIQIRETRLVDTHMTWCILFW